jgi:ribosome-associated protein
MVIFSDKIFLMEPTSLHERKLEDECVFTAMRSGGPGGQHVNKVNTKIELRFDVNKSTQLSDEEKEMILTRLKQKISEDGILIITAQESRSQLKNKQSAIEKFYQSLEAALKKKRKRIPVKIPTVQKEKRLEEKKQKAEKKAMRKPPYV